MSSAQNNTTNVDVNDVERCSACKGVAFRGQCINQRCFMFGMGSRMRNGIVRQGLATINRIGFDPIQMVNGIRRRQNEERREPNNNVPLSDIARSKIDYWSRINSVTAGRVAGTGISRRVRRSSKS